MRTAQDIFIWLRNNKVKIIAVLVVLVMCFGVVIFSFRCSRPEPVPQDNAVIVHQFDSVRYIKSNDSLKARISTLEEEKAKLTASHTAGVVFFDKKISAVQTLPANDVAEAFSGRIYNDVVIQVKNGDTNILTPMQGIKNALVLFIERDRAIYSMNHFMSLDSLNNDIINNKDQMIGIKDDRIKKLTDEFYQGEMVKAGLRSDIEKANKKISRKNIFIGVSLGVAATATAIAILK